MCVGRWMHRFLQGLRRRCRLCRQQRRDLGKVSWVASCSSLGALGTFVLFNKSLKCLVHPNRMALFNLSTIYVAIVAVGKLICYSNSTRESFCEAPNFFQCDSRRCIVRQFVCDYQNDCGVGDDSDEKNCTCEWYFVSHSYQSFEISLSFWLYLRLSRQVLSIIITVVSCLHVYMITFIVSLVIIIHFFIILLLNNLDKTATRDRTGASLESASRCGWDAMDTTIAETTVTRWTAVSCHRCQLCNFAMTISWFSTLNLLYFLSMFVLSINNFIIAFISDSSSNYFY